MPAGACAPAGPPGITRGFPRLSPSGGQVLHALLSRSPLASPRRGVPFDLHVLGAPPAFILSQDRTLRPNGRTGETGALDFLFAWKRPLGCRVPSPASDRIADRIHSLVRSSILVPRKVIGACRMADLTHLSTWVHELLPPKWYRSIHRSIRFSRYAPRRPWPWPHPRSKDVI